MKLTHNKNDSGEKTAIKKASDHSGVDKVALAILLNGEFLCHLILCAKYIYLYC